MKKLLSVVTALTFTAGAFVGAYLLAMIVDRYGKVIREGDLVQWESGGKIMFETPRKVLKIMSSEYGTFVLVEGSKTGIPMEEVRKIEPEISAVTA